jgi:hypothetical protein
MHCAIIENVDKYGTCRKVITRVHSTTASCCALLGTPAGSDDASDSVLGDSPEPEEGYRPAIIARQTLALSGGSDIRHTRRKIAVL